VLEKTMRKHAARTVPVALAALTVALPLNAQRVAEPSERLGYRFPNPTQTAVDHARSGLQVLGGEVITVHRQSGDSIAELIARVDDATWTRNPEVRGGDPSRPEALISFGKLRTYLQEDRRYRILALPAYCSGCEGQRRIIFLPYADSTGHLVGSSRSPK
jgi:hypothetical protein